MLRTRTAWLLFGLLTAVFGVLLLWPVLTVVSGGFFVNGRFTVRYLAGVFRNPIYAEGLANSLRLLNLPRRTNQSRHPRTHRQDTSHQRVQLGRESLNLGRVQCQAQGPRIGQPDILPGHAYDAPGQVTRVGTTI